MRPWHARSGVRVQSCNGRLARRAGAFVDEIEEALLTVADRRNVGADLAQHVEDQIGAVVAHRVGVAIGPLNVKAGHLNGACPGSSTAILRRFVSIEPLGARVLTLTGEVRDLQQRFTALEHRFTAMEHRLTGIEGRLGGREARFSAQEDRMTAMRALIVRIAERVGEPAR
jgi:hypothetical protein